MVYPLIRSPKLNCFQEDFENNLSLICRWEKIIIKMVEVLTVYHIGHSNFEERIWHKSSEPLCVKLHLCNEYRILFPNMTWGYMQRAVSLHSRYNMPLLSAMWTINGTGAEFIAQTTGDFARNVIYRLHKPRPVPKKIDFKSWNSPDC